jgi:hypothetical protein
MNEQPRRLLEDHLHHQALVLEVVDAALEILVALRRIRPIAASHSAICFEHRSRSSGSSAARSSPG